MKKSSFAYYNLLLSKSSTVNTVSHSPWDDKNICFCKILNKLKAQKTEILPDLNLIMLFSTNIQGPRSLLVRLGHASHPIICKMGQNILKLCTFKLGLVVYPTDILKWPPQCEKRSVVSDIMNLFGRGVISRGHSALVSPYYDTWLFIMQSNKINDMVHRFLVICFQFHLSGYLIALSQM